MFRPKVGLAEVPGATTRVDLDGHLYNTSKFPAFQDRLKSINEDYRLAFDRAMGRWCIYRNGIEIRKLDWEDATLSHAVNVPSVIHDIAWWVRDRETHKVTPHLRTPDTPTLHELAAKSREEMAWNNSRWASAEIDRQGEAAYERSQKRTREVHDATMSEFKSRISGFGGGGFNKPIVTVPEIPA